MDARREAFSDLLVISDIHKHPNKPSILIKNFSKFNEKIVEEDLNFSNEKFLSSVNNAINKMND